MGKSKGFYLRLSAFICGSMAFSVAAEPYRFDDIRLGASFQSAARELDLRDIHAAVAVQQEARAPKPDLGRRGYGCARRDDAFGDIGCVSHDERVDGAETREIRLLFLDGMLQQFSITAEIRYYDAVMEALRGRYGLPQRTEPAPPGGYPSEVWSTTESRIIAYGGKDLIFVSFELASYGDAVKRRQSGTPVNECR